ncbi:MAG: hypothetical protein F2528_03545 [Actinobacteria bacterium]|uniref:Unannotated protein n=2 Tax=freshwater metagenome TaxID=449393 RepID=A0A6J6BX12_9ZZZZ|nr:hypothetical protein [Actinomycetota bacterium]
MFEFLFIAALVYLYLERRARKKREGKRLRGLDAELKAIVENDGDKTGIAFEIKQYLLAIIEDDKSGVEKFSDARILQAERILDRAGPSAMYWMTDIATQLAFLAAAKINGTPTNIDEIIGENPTPEAIVKAVVKG